MKTSVWMASLLLAGGLLGACNRTSAPSSAWLTGCVNDYPGKGFLLLINNEDRDAPYDTLQVQADGSFAVEVPTDHGTPRLLYLEYLGDNRRSIHCYLIPGDTLDVAITGGMQEVPALMGEGTEQRYVCTPVFSGSSRRESEYLNLPPYFSFKFKNDDGSPVSFRNYKEQIAAQQRSLRARLEGTRPEFSAEQEKRIEKIPDEWYFAYARRLWVDGNDPGQDADFMAYLNSIDMNDTLNCVRNGFVNLTGDCIATKLKLHPELYKGEPHSVRYLSFVRDSISNPRAQEILSDNYINIQLNMGSNADLVRIFEMYRTLSGKSQQYCENEKIYKNLSKLLPGVQATDFEMQDTEGNSVRFLDVIGQGKVTYIDFWATWCGPCCAEIPYVEKLVERYKNNPNIEFLSISLDKDLKKWHEKLERDRPTWRQYVIPDNFESAFAKEYNIRAIPRFMVFDKEGKIISINAERPSHPNIDRLINGYINQK